MNEYTRRITMYVNVRRRINPVMRVVGQRPDPEPEAATVDEAFGDAQADGADEHVVPVQGVSVWRLFDHYLSHILPFVGVAGATNVRGWHRSVERLGCALRCGAPSGVDA